MVQSKSKQTNKSVKPADAKKTPPKNFEVKASLRFLRMAPKKVRLVVDVIRNLDVQSALDQLHFINKAATHPLIKLINSAIANAENNFGLQKNNLVIKKFIVNEGPTLKRWQPRAHGRATPIRKRSSHIELVLEDISGQRPGSKSIKKAKEEVKVVTAQEAKKTGRVEEKEESGGQTKEKFYQKGFTKKLFSRKTGNS